MAELFIDDVIGEDFFGEGITARSFRAELAEVDPEEELLLRINSPGGSVFEAATILSALARHQGPVNVLVEGLAASAASYIAMAGQHIGIASGGMLMIHEPWSIVVGNSQEMVQEAGLLDKIALNLVESYAERSGMKADQVREAMRAETWYTAKEAVAAGLADEVVSTSAKAIAVPKVFGYRNQPQPQEQAAVPHLKQASHRAAQLLLAKARGTLVG